MSYHATKSDIDKSTVFINKPVKATYGIQHIEGLSRNEVPPFFKPVVQALTAISQGIHSINISLFGTVLLSFTFRANPNGESQSSNKIETIQSEHDQLPSYKKHNIIIEYKGVGISIYSQLSSSNEDESNIRAILLTVAKQVEEEARKLWIYKPSVKLDDPTVESQSIGISLDLSKEIERLAKCSFNALVRGETGVGKTHLVRQVHDLSDRSNKPFIPFNCATISPDLIEAELFGYKKGSFTGANNDRVGLFEAANGGTLFLDEIGDLPMPTQCKLLLAIEDKKIRRLGDNEYRHCDIRIIAATSRDLRAMVKEGTFREDLYYRISTLKTNIPPLRDRRELIAPLINQFLKEASTTSIRLASERKHFNIECGAVALLHAFDWPGNIRMLRNSVFELTSYTDDSGVVRMEDVAEYLSSVPIFKEDVSTSNTILPSLEIPSMEDIKGFLEALANPGDIVIHPEICIIRKEETLYHWEGRTTQVAIEAARDKEGGIELAANRLGLAPVSLKQRRRRAVDRITFSNNSKRSGMDLPAKL
jgi:transcriptional regulator with PAS, ATPase and Fis domain